MFFGNFQHHLDEKFRLMIPKKMREEAGNKLYIMKGYEGALSVFKAEDFNILVSTISKLPFEQKNARDFIRIQLATACELDVDRSGRIQIPTHLINKYSISHDVIVIGVGDHFEIWNKDKYLAYEKEIEVNFENNAEKLIKHEN